METLTTGCSLTALVVAFAPAISTANCDCQSGGTHAAAPHAHIMPYAAPMMAAPGVPVMSATPMMLGVSPPPGSIGSTYTLRSLPVSRKSHPRTGVVEITGWDHVEHVSAVGLNPYRSREGNWVLETEDPLVPWVPHVFTIEARHDRRDKRPYDKRVVRLIPGRIIEVKF